MAWHKSKPFYDSEVERWDNDDGRVLVINALPGKDYIDEYGLDVIQDGVPVSGWPRLVYEVDATDEDGEWKGRLEGDFRAFTVKAHAISYARGYIKRHGGKR